MYAEVQSTHQLTPDLLRVVLAGGTLDEFEGSAATDAYVNARFVPQDSPVTVPFVIDDLDALPREQRPRPRRFTVRPRHFWASRPTTQKTAASSNVIGVQAADVRLWQGSPGATTMPAWIGLSRAW